MIVGGHVDAPREVPQHTGGAQQVKARRGANVQRVYGIHHIGGVRRATPADAAAIAMFAPERPAAGDVAITARYS